MSEFFGDTGEVWDSEDDDPMLGGMGKPRLDLADYRHTITVFKPIPWYVRLWRWVVGA